MGGSVKSNVYSNYLNNQLKIYEQKESSAKNKTQILLYMWCY